MREDFLHYLWRLRRFDTHGLKTTAGESIEILDTGVHNTHAGPDFQNAKLRIGDWVWGGCVEMHVKASEWRLHKHQDDPAYNNVILHVVYEADVPAERVSGQFPCLELKRYVPEGVYQRYWGLLHNEYWIPCQHQFFAVPDIVKNSWLDRLTVERLEGRTAEIEEALERNRNNWEETFYQFLARRFGAKINAEPFDWLARSTPNLVLSKHRNNLMQLEALLFGQAGMLEHVFTDEYPKGLQKEYGFLKHKHQLEAINPAAWKFLRLRPANFPTVRIAQLATLAHQSIHLFSKILEIETVQDIEDLLEVNVGDYWLTHYVFEKESVKRNKSLGQNAIHILIINTIAPFLFLYGKLKGEGRFKDKALELLEGLPPEDNYIIKGWVKMGVEPDSAYRTQGLLQLKNLYCDKKRCLECAVGSVVLK